MSRLSLSLTLTLVVVLGGCGSSSKPPVGKVCTLNSECNNPLSCTFGKCHNACVETRDCPAGQRCLKVPGGNVCQLDEEKHCPSTGMCQQPLICAIDLLCHNNCTTMADCPGQQVCASGACAESWEVGSDGKLMAPSDGGAGGAGGGGGGTDAGIDAAPVMGNGPCGVPETEPNDTRDNPVRITAPTMFPSCIGTPKDVDFYELTTPSDPGGGYYQFSITEVGNVEVGLVAYSVSDKGKLTELYTDSAGQDLHGFLAAAAGEKYWLAVSAFAGANDGPAKYTLKVTFTKVADMYEPNDTKETAKPITLGTPIMAFMHQGFQAGAIKVEDVVDWYSVTAAAGDVTVKVENVPTNLEADVFIYDSTGKMARGYSSNDGANAMVTLMGVAAGPVYIQVQPFFIGADAFIERAKAPGMVPDQFTRPYKLTVSQ
jgi:hypothetical protein